MNYFLIAVTVLSAFFVESYTAVDGKYLDSAYANYVAQFGKKYDTDDEYNVRKALFAANLQAIQNFNSDGSNDYKIGINQFSDLKPEEKAAFLGLIMNAKNSTDNNAATNVASTENKGSANNVLTASAFYVPMNNTSYYSGSSTYYYNSSPSSSSYYYSNTVPVSPVVPASNSSSNKVPVSPVVPASNSSNNKVPVSPVVPASNGSRKNAATNTTPASTTPASTTPANTTPASTTPANTTPANTTPANTTPAYTTPAATTPTTPVVYTMQTIPTSVNLVTAGMITPVKNQGSCGACYAFSATALVEAMFKKKFKTDVDLSEQQIISCSSNNACNGGTIGTALSYVKSYGLSSDTTIPYNQSSTTNMTCPSALTTFIATTMDVVNNPSTSTNVELASYTGLQGNSLLELLTALQTGPVSIAIYVVDALYNYTSGLFSASNCSGISGLNHAVLAVGYSLTGDSTTNNKPYLLIKNSWSTSWGENGYFKLELDLTDTGANTCNILTPGYNFTATLL